MSKMQVKRLHEDGESNASDMLNSETALEKSPLRNITNLCHDNIAFTPKKSKVEFPNPNTPNCNIKLLTSVAASLEYVKGTDKENEADTPVQDKKIKKLKRTPSLKSRKEKSISVICEKFISEFPEYPEDGKLMQISLSESAFYLGVEKRRVYDIVNILESVEMVKKSGKNEYIWCGKTNLIFTLQTLKNLALLNGVDEVVKSVIDVHEDFNLGDESSVKEALPLRFFAAFKKEKSLGTLTRQFLSLFLTSEKPQVISLGLAAQLLLGNTECTSISKKKTDFKTKVRRLYDVANVLSPLCILKREKSLHGCGSPLFRYCGPDLWGNGEGSEIKSVAESEKLNNFKTFNLMSSKKKGFVETFSRTKSENWHSGHPKSVKKLLSFPRFSSLQDVCDVAEIEHAKMFGSVSSPLFNENSNDSSFSFLSCYSTDASFTESQLEGFKPIEMATESSPLSQDSVSDVSIPETAESSSQHDPENPPEKDIDDDTLKLIECPISTDNSDNHQVVQLSSQQQTAVLNYLNMSYKHGQAALLLIPNEQSDCSTNGDASPKRKIVLPMSLFVDLKNRQSGKKTLLNATDAHPLLTTVSENNLENSAVKSNNECDCAKNKQITVICDSQKLGVKTLKLLPSVETKKVSKAISVSPINGHVENGNEKTLDKPVCMEYFKGGSLDTCNLALDIAQAMNPPSLNINNERNESLNGTVVSRKVSCSSCGSQNIKVVVNNLSALHQKIQNSTAASAIKEKVVSTPITVHLKKPVHSETTKIEKVADSPKDRKTFIGHTMPIVVIRKPVDRFSGYAIPKIL